MELKRYGRNAEELPPFLSFGELTYDINEIDHRYFIRDHKMVGCISLMCTQPMDLEHPGRAYLDEKELQECWYYVMDLPEHGNPSSICIPVRGTATEYDREYILRLEGFRNKEGMELPVFETKMRTLPRNYPDEGYAQRNEIAIQAAREGMVLLKNDCNVLPLKPGGVLNLFGEGVINYRTAPNGAGRIKPRSMRSLLEAVRETSSFRLNEELENMHFYGQNEVPQETELRRAKEKSDTAVIVLTRGTGENLDNRAIPGEYYLAEREENLIGAVSGVFENIVVVLNTGYPIDMRWLKKYGVKGVLYAGLSGQASAEALCEILDGRTNPSGKTPDTWAWTYEDIPASKNFLDSCYEENIVTGDNKIWAQTCYEEGIYIGYRYFETFHKEVAFCFGHGLSYTDFSTEVSPPQKEQDGGIQIKAAVTNTGDRAGKEVIQVYVKLPGTLQEQPDRQLAAFAKTGLLMPGQKEELEFNIAPKRLATYVEEKGAWIQEEGLAEFYVGSSVARAVLCGHIQQKEMVLQRTAWRLPCPVTFDELSKYGKRWPEGGLTRYLPKEKALTHTLSRDFGEQEELGYHPLEVPITYGQLQADTDLMAPFIAQMSNAELTRLNMMYSQEWTMDSNGVAGRMAPVEPYGFPDYKCADGNNSLLISEPNIGMPSSTMVCASFNPELAYQAAYTLASEAREHNIRMLLAPGMNLHRNPLSGRNAEYFGEDPYLVGIMAASYVKGLHDMGVSDSTKHIVCNNCETVRKRNHSLVSERALRELYLRSFEVLLEETELDSIMTGYNALNGAMCGNDPVLIDGIFRDELGFDGFAVTDWNSYETIDMVEAVRAGISWLTPGETDGSLTAVLAQEMEDGRLRRGELERNAERVFRVMLRRLK